MVWEWRHFGLDLADADTYRRRSRIEVKTADTYKDSGFAYQQGLADPLLWVTEGLDWYEHCPDFVGHIELARPIVRPECVLDIFRILDAHFRDAEVQLNRPTGFAVDGKQISPEDIAEILEGHPPILIEGGNAGTSHGVIAPPADMILRVLPVPSMDARPTLGIDFDDLDEGRGVFILGDERFGGNIFAQGNFEHLSEADLTHKLVDILRINQRIIENLEQGAPELIVNDLWELLQYHITTYFDNKTRGIPPARHRSGRPLKTIAQHINILPSDSVIPRHDLWLELDSELRESVSIVGEIDPDFRDRWILAIAKKIEEDTGTRFFGWQKSTFGEVLMSSRVANIEPAVKKAAAAVKKDESKTKKRSATTTKVEHEVEKVSFKDVKGFEPLITWLKNMGRRFTPEGLERFGRYPTGVLLTGVPGCGKSMVAKAIAHEWKLGYRRVMPDELVGSYQGNNEKAMRKLMNELEKTAPTVCFMDEAEKFLGQVRSQKSYHSSDAGRDSSESILLQFMQDNNSGVFFVFTANDFEKMSPALIDRFDEKWFIDLPPKQGRIEIIQAELERRPKVSKEIDFDELGRMSKKFSGRDIIHSIDEAEMSAFIDGDRNMEFRDLVDAFDKRTPISVIHESRITAMRELVQEGKLRRANTHTQEDPSDAGSSFYI